MKYRTMNIDRLREIISYDPKTGIFKSLKTGKTLGKKPDAHGYIVIRIDGRKFQASRLAFALTENRWPEEEIDHINRDRQDNTAGNIREASDSIQMINRNKLSSNTSGTTGVRQRKSGRWHAFFSRPDGPYNLGTFDTLEEAVAAREAEIQRVYGGIFDNNN